MKQVKGLKRRYLSIIIIYIGIICVGLFIAIESSSFQNITSEHAVTLTGDSFSPNFNLHYIASDGVGLHSYETTLTREQLEIIPSEIYKLLVFRLSDQAYRVYFNEVCIGSVGDMQGGRSNIWNSLTSFEIDSKTVQGVNSLRFETYASYLSGLNNNPIYIVSETIGMKKAAQIYLYGDQSVLFSIGFIIFSAIIIIILFIHAKTKTSTYIYYAIGTLLIGIYFFDYLKSEYLSVSYLIYKKTTMVALFYGIGFYSLTIYKFFGEKILKYLALFTMAGFGIIVLKSTTLLAFKADYNLWYLMIILNMLMWIGISIKHLKRNAYALAFLSSFIISIIYVSITIALDLSGSYFNLNSPIIYLISLSAMPLIMMYKAIGEKNDLLHEEKTLREIDFMKSITDELTGAWNQRYMFVKLKEMDASYTVTMIDVDDFKGINDTYGHPAGDYILKAIGKMILKRLDASDILCRYGGDEFVLLSHEHTEAEIYELMERIRSQIADVPFVYDHQKIIVSISIGIHKVQKGESVEGILKEVDKQLYLSKANGKNCVSMV